MINNIRMKIAILAKLFIAAIFLVQMTGCATSGNKVSRIKAQAGIVNEEGYAQSNNKKCLVGKTSNGKRIIVVFDQKKCDLYGAKEDGNFEKIEYDGNKKEFLIYHDGKCGSVPESR